ncbi:hypothetical protein P2318_03205 [Myxococcaceae bacterium GXIMD 01537]
MLHMLLFFWPVPKLEAPPPKRQPPPPARRRAPARGTPKKTRAVAGAPSPARSRRRRAVKRGAVVR